MARTANPMNFQTHSVLIKSATPRNMISTTNILGLSRFRMCPQDWFDRHNAGGLFDVSVWADSSAIPQRGKCVAVDDVDAQLLNQRHVCKIRYEHICSSQLITCEDQDAFLHPRLTMLV